MTILECASVGILAFLSGLIFPMRRTRPSSPPLAGISIAPLISGRPLRLLAGCVIKATLNDGRRVLDASDFKKWLEELAEAADRVVA